eukprot:5932189-Karenia_brevis.AAC.1
MTPPISLTSGRLHVVSFSAASRCGKGVQWIRSAGWQLISFSAAIVMWQIGLLGVRVGEAEHPGPGVDGMRSPSHSRSPRRDDTPLQAACATGDTWLDASDDDSELSVPRHPLKVARAGECEGSRMDDTV